MKFRIEKGEAAGQGKPRKVAHLTISLPGAFWLGGLLVLGLVWVFILGVLVGRGYQPEDTVPELARIMPAPAEENATALTPEPGVLQPEELQFYDSLKAQPAQQAAPKTADAPPRPPKTAPKPAAQAAEQAPAAASPAPEITAKPAEEPVAKPAAPASAGQRFRYVYQVASFRKYEMARAFQDKIEALGVATAVEDVTIKDVTWSRVNVYFTGAPEETEAFKDSLKKVGVDRVILRSKTVL